MKQEDVISFFDRMAPNWDNTIRKNDAVIRRILNNAEVHAGQDVLDVACGTGVMFPFYKELGVNHITAIDISPEMIRIAKEKFGDDDSITLLCGDVETVSFDRKFDCVVVYNAFPHFPEPKRLLRTLCGLLKEGGRLTIAHGDSRAAIDSHHHGAAAAVSNGLMPAENLMDLFSPLVNVEVMVTNDFMYQVSGVKRDLFAAEPEPNPSILPVDASVSLTHTLALMQYMVSHNDAHSQELAELASELGSVGKERACRRIMEAVAGFDVANAQLDAVLTELREEENN